VRRLNVVIDPLPTAEDDFVFFKTRSMTRESYLAFVQANPDLRIERKANGEVIVMPPAHSRTGFQNIRIASQVDAWAPLDGTGVAFDSSAGFDLPNGANRAPAAAWVLKSRIAPLTPEERDGYLPLCPDFIIALRSKTDRLSDLHEKMQEYIDNSARLGWLIDPISFQVFIYRPGIAPETLMRPETLFGNPVPSGFTLDLRAIWRPEV